MPSTLAHLPPAVWLIAGRPASGPPDRPPALFVGQRGLGHVGCANAPRAAWWKRGTRGVAPKSDRPGGGGISRKRFCGRRA
jgi:hypothetical protein